MWYSKLYINNSADHVQTDTISISITKSLETSFKSKPYLTFTKYLFLCINLQTI